MLRFVAAILIFVSTAVTANPADTGWKVYRTFEYNIILWEKADGENFMRYAVTNEAGATMCIIPHVHSGPRTRSGLQVTNLLKTGSFHELGFVTYTTGSKPGSAKWVVTLILIENQCSLPVSQPPTDSLPEPLS